MALITTVTGLIRMVAEMTPESCFELGIGTGYPFARAFLDQGVAMSGCDIADMLLEELKRNCPEAKICKGGYEDLQSVSAVFRQKYDVVYCFRSTWYFSDMGSAIDFMLYFVKPGGVVIFDIMNKDSIWNQKIIKRKNTVFPLTAVKNVFKSAVNFFAPNSYMLDKVFGVHDIMRSPDEVSRILAAKKCNYSILNLSEVTRK